jgi:hypothetical protein
MIIELSAAMTMGHKDVKTAAMKYQHPHMETVRAALNKAGAGVQAGGA